MNRLHIVLKEDLIARTQLFFREYAVFCKQIHALVSDQVRHRVRKGLEIVESPLFCFRNPLVGITVAVEQNLLVLVEELL